MNDCHKFHSMSGNLKTDRKAGQELSAASAALDRLFNEPRLPVKDTRIIFSARNDDLTLTVTQYQAEVEVIIGNL